MRLLIACVLACLAGAAPVAAQPYPARPITMVIGFGKGTTAEIIGVVVAEVLSKNLGQPVKVELKPGDTFDLKTFVTPQEATSVHGTLKMKTTCKESPSLDITVNGTVAGSAPQVSNPVTPQSAYMNDVVSFFERISMPGTAPWA